MKRSILLRFGLFILLGMSLPLAAQSEGKLTTPLQNVIQEKGEQAIVKAWIYFIDKGGGVESKLAQAEANLTPRARDRRLRLRGADDLVDFKDIPVNGNYLQQVRSRVEKIRHKSRWLNAVSVEASGAQLKMIAQFPFVKKIDLVRVGRMPEPEVEAVPPAYPSAQESLLNYGASFDQNNQINTIPLHDKGYNGSEVLVCMLDAGFNNIYQSAANPGHEALRHLNILFTYDFVNGDSIVWDQPGQMGTGDHGTYTLSALAGFKEGQLIGPGYGADFILAKTENTDYERNIEEDHWVAGAEWADSLGADIISSSLGYRDFDFGQISYTWQDMDGNTAVSTIGADIAASRGILVVNSAGNEGSASPPQNSLIAPADGDSVVAVGAVSSSGSRASFSSMGPTADGRIKPDVMARGVSTVSASASNPTNYLGVSGTSLSCPLVAGASAQILQVNPYLSNMRVLQALKKTANNTNSPNNSYGWGIIDAYAAAFYYTPELTHTPLPDTEDLAGPYAVQAEITSTFPLIGDSIQVRYRINQGAFQSAQMVYQGGNNYEAAIVGSGNPATISYYIKAVSDSGFAYFPPRAPAVLFQFEVGSDTVPPVIAHTPLQTAAYLTWPAKLRATITDNVSLDENEVFVEWNLNGVAQSDFSLHRIQGDLFEGVFNADATQVAIGDMVQYRIVASDAAGNPNTAYHPQVGFHEFEIVETRGIVLLLDDESSTRGKIEDRGDIINYQPRGVNSSTSRIQQYLQELNFLVTVESANLSDTAGWDQYQLLISASGENPSPVADPVYRQSLIDYVQDGGKLLIEGGEVGYDAVSGTGYPTFAAQVLHSTNWNGDNEGPLTLLSSQQNHPIASTPNQLPGSIALNYNSSSGWYDQDAMTPDNQSYIVYECQNEPGDAGILVYDDNPYPESAQMVYYPFDFASVIDTTVAKHLLENTLVFLLTDDSPTAIDDDAFPIADRFELYPAYPNPFNPTTRIRFTLPENGEVTLAIYNNLGQKVVTLVDGYRKAGEHRLTWDGAEYASGVYYLMLRWAQGQKVQKLLLVR